MSRMPFYTAPVIMLYCFAFIARSDRHTHIFCTLLLLKFSGAVNPHPYADQGEIWQGERSAPPCQISLKSAQRATQKSARE